MNVMRLVQMYPGAANKIVTAALHEKKDLRAYVREHHS
jgi:hypothetical protein